VWVCGWVGEFDSSNLPISPLNQASRRGQFGVKRHPIFLHLL
jgi:hypothetical protein